MSSSIIIEKCYKNQIPFLLKCLKKANSEDLLIKNINYNNTNCTRIKSVNNKITSMFIHSESNDNNHLLLPVI